MKEFGVLLRKIALTAVLIFVISPSVLAQYDPQISQTYNAASLINPAMMSLDGSAKAMALFRSQYIGLEGAPTTFFVDLHAPFTFGETGTHVFGLRFMNDKIGLFTNNGFDVRYAYQRKLGDGNLSVGADIGGLFVKFNGSDVFIPEKGDYHTQPSEDKLIPQGDNNNGFGFDLSLGVAYGNEKYQVGLSVWHLTGAKIRVSDYTYVKVTPLVQLFGGYRFTFSNTKFFLMPSAYLKSDFRSWQLDANLTLGYGKFYGGVSYRVNAVVLMLGVKNFKKFDVEISYDIETSKLMSVSAGSVEATLAYHFKLEFEKKKKYKSVRIL